MAADGGDWGTGSPRKRFARHRMRPSMSATPGKVCVDGVIRFDGGVRFQPELTIQRTGAKGPGERPFLSARTTTRYGEAIVTGPASPGPKVRRVAGAVGENRSRTYGEALVTGPANPGL